MRSRSATAQAAADRWFTVGRAGQRVFSAAPLKSRMKPPSSKSGRVPLAENEGRRPESRVDVNAGNASIETTTMAETQSRKVRARRVRKSQRGVQYVCTNAKRRKPTELASSHGNSGRV